jgi:alpha-L-arabinofuranosidase
LLFDLKSDPGEQTNLAGRFPDKVAALGRRLGAIQKGEAGSAGVGPATSDPAAPCMVTVDVGDMRGRISPMLMGFNLVYKYEQDSVWADGKVEKALKELKCGLLRWPGGTVVSSYHWTNANSPDYMDLAEYMGHVRAIGAEPLVGVNVYESYEAGKEETGLAEARALIEHCVQKQFRVKYWYLDNEMSLPNPKPRMSAEEYARAIRKYAAVLRAVDPGVEIVANWDVRWSPGWEQIVQLAGKDIGAADFHLYYHALKELSWDSWMQDTPMTMLRPTPDGPRRWGRIPFSSMIEDFRTQARSRGCNWKLGALEWNLGKNLVGPMSPFQAALVEAEEFGQFINAGLDMACFWPFHMATGNKYRVLLDHQTGRLHPNFEMFKMYSDVLGHAVAGSAASVPEVRTVAARSGDGKTITVYLLRKSGEAPPLPTTVQVIGFAHDRVKAVCFSAPRLDAERAEVKPVELLSTSPVKLELPPHSFTQITYSGLATE